MAAKTFSRGTSFPLKVTVCALLLLADTCKQAAIRMKIVSFITNSVLVMRRLLPGADHPRITVFNIPLGLFGDVISSLTRTIFRVTQTFGRRCRKHFRFFV